MPDLCQHSWKLLHEMNQHRFKCERCGVLSHKYRSNKPHAIYSCSHTTIVDGRRKSDCTKVATEWHGEAGYCKEHKPISRSAQREIVRRRKVAEEDRRKADLREAFADDMLTLRARLAEKPHPQQDQEPTLGVRDSWPDLPDLL